MNFFIGIVMGTGAMLLGWIFTSGASGAVKVGAFLAWLVWAVLASAYENEAQKARLQRFAHFAPLPYRRAFAAARRALPRLLLPKTIAEVPPPPSWWRYLTVWVTIPLARDRADQARLIANPWSWPVLEFAVRVAVMYPILFVLAQHAATGAVPQIPALANIFDVLSRAFSAIVLALFVVLGALRLAGVFWPRPSLTKLNDALMTLLLIAFVLILPVGIMRDEAPPYFFAMITLIIIHTILEGERSTLMFVLVAVLPIGQVAIGFTGVDGWSFGSVNLISIVPTLLGSSLLMALIGWGSRHRMGVAMFLFVLLIGCGSAIWVLALMGPSQYNVLIIVFALFPLVNGFFDWLSYGITIWLLSRGHRQGGIWPLLSGLADLVAALLCLLLLGGALITTMKLMMLAGGKPIFDVIGLLEGIRAAPGEHLWIIAMAGSTFVPTALHLLLALLSAVTWLRAGLWNWLVGRLDVAEGTEVALGASLGLASLLLTYVALPAFLIYAIGWLVVTHGDIVGHALLDLLRLYSEWLGVSGAGILPF
ncbi:hypothetical protein [Pseudoroseicyclus sp. CXY001]|uniref:hypothetical protein n=1 Tax=Pseudoroseicyclus sp. CXY001 TaxID=3242492 RepID=UPI0035715DC5